MSFSICACSSSNSSDRRASWELSSSMMASRSARSASCAAIVASRVAIVACCATRSACVFVSEASITGATPSGAVRVGLFDPDFFLSAWLTAERVTVTARLPAADASAVVSELLEASPYVMTRSRGGVFRSRGVRAPPAVLFLILLAAVVLSRRALVRLGAVDGRGLRNEVAPVLLASDSIELRFREADRVCVSESLPRLSSNSSFSCCSSSALRFRSTMASVR
mmetsp:Transcript_15447/g.22624  ORF Transcript_15447/g.22624 Transcript_15447/m.22624 type:complete len:224 (+) Transcript_15447:781-1452(+)